VVSRILLVRAFPMKPLTPKIRTFMSSPFV
jgi:hypothetical protein